MKLEMIVMMFALFLLIIIGGNAAISLIIKIRRFFSYRKAKKSLKELTAINKRMQKETWK